MAAIERLRAEGLEPGNGAIEWLQLDLGDPRKVKESAEKFAEKETRLDVLFNNAGVMAPPQGSKSAQGYELHVGTNNVGPHLLTRLLTPMLVATAKAEAEAKKKEPELTPQAIIEATVPKVGISTSHLYKAHIDVLCRAASGRGHRLSL